MSSETTCTTVYYIRDKWRGVRYEPKTPENFSASEYKKVFSSLIRRNIEFLASTLKLGNIGKCEKSRLERIKAIKCQTKIYVLTIERVFAACNSSNGDFFLPSSEVNIK